MRIYRPSQDGKGYMQISRPKSTMKSYVSVIPEKSESYEESGQYIAVSSFLLRRIKLTANAAAACRDLNNYENAAPGR